MNPYHINSNGSTSFSTIDHQMMTTSMQSIMEKSSHGYGGDDHFNSHVILEKKCGSSKKDRHRKINTARGPKDRRIRLSLEVAKKFFKLQDILGFDKASNTIKWLLMMSKPAIQDLRQQKLSQSCRNSNSLSSGSECEVMSGIDDQSLEKFKEKKRVETDVRKVVCIDHSLAKETREKARERARKRTTEKRKIKLGCCDGAGSDQYSKLTKLRPSGDQVMGQCTSQLGSWIPFGEDQIQLITDQAGYPSSHFEFKQGNFGDYSSMMSSNWSPSFLFNYHHDLGLSDHEHQFSHDFQILGKPWEGINN